LAVETVMACDLKFFNSISFKNGQADLFDWKNCSCCLASLIFCLSSTCKNALTGHWDEPTELTHRAQKDREKLGGAADRNSKSPVFCFKSKTCL